MAIDHGTTPGVAGRTPERPTAWIATVIAGALTASALARGGDPPASPAPHRESIYAQQVPPPSPGYPRPWQGSLAVATYSHANLSDGNLLTTIPLTRWTGRGPAMSFAVFHNSADEQWRTSYSAHIAAVQPNRVRFIDDDGTSIDFTKRGGTWTPQAGFFHTLDEQPNGWILARKEQTTLEFDDAGRLVAIVDSSGNTLSITRDPNNGGRILSIFDATGRGLTLDYGPGDILPESVVESFQVETDAGPRQRAWALDEDSSGFLLSVTDPMGFAVATTPEPGTSRIASIADKDGNAFSYAYSTAGRIRTITDPPPFAHQTQRFSYGSQISVQTGTRYVDRRGASWYFGFTTGVRTLSSAKDPLGHVTRFEHDADNNLTEVCNAANDCWAYSYDDRGNLLTAVTPLQHTTTFTYDLHNNITSIQDPLGGTISLDYEHPDDPTLVTRIAEPPDGQGNPVATTEITYWDGGDASCDGCQGDEWTGMLASIRGPAAVGSAADGMLTTHTYDQYGQTWEEIEGDGPGVGVSTVVARTFSHGPAGWLKARSTRWTRGQGSGGSGGTGSGGSSRDANGRVVGSTCIAFPVGPLHGVGQQQYHPPTPDLPGLDDPLSGWLVSGSYDNMDRPLDLVSLVSDPSRNDLSSRTISYAYDALGRLTGSAQDSSESGSPIGHAFSYEQDWAAGSLVRTDDDANESTLQIDAVHRAVGATRTHPDGTDTTVDVEYHATGRPRLVAYGNGTLAEYVYDRDERLEEIIHTQADGTVLLRLRYTYDPRGLITRLEEHDDVGFASDRTYTYDARGRLLTESATGELEFDIAYTYDNAGNRRSKSVLTSGMGEPEITTYFYDVDDPGQYGSRMNRLLWTETGQDGAHLATTYYVYTPAGHVGEVVTRLEGDPVYYGRRLVYDRSQTLVWMVIDEHWELDETGEVVNHMRTAVEEYRYDDPEVRYLRRTRDPDDLTTVLTEEWSLHDGRSIYADYVVENGEASVVRSFFRGVSVLEAGAPAYQHSDHLGSTRMTTDDQSEVIVRSAYTAFGEPLAVSPGTRYGFVGDWGYETLGVMAGPGLPALVHVGQRFYDVASGRFLQRDPIGIDGGLNVFEYAGSQPTMAIDPLGTMPLWVAKSVIWVTGGDRWAGKKIDKMGRGITRKRTARRQAFRAAVVACGFRVPKRIRLPGQTRTSSVWTKLPGIKPWVGRIIGKAFIPLTLAEGGVAAYDLVTTW